jgi:OFA family oxalate/formate antiporter-like MFS transporter
MNNKWTRAAIPAILLHICIGSVYSFSLFAKPISDYIGYSQSKVQFAFSLAIFFLGMSAAFGGAFVEKDIHRSSLLSTLCFCGGLLITALAVHLKSLWLLYIGYGVVLGVGLGIGYLSPVKTLMLWFKDNKGLATGISVCAFGFASTIASPIITTLLNKASIEQTFMMLAGIYFVPMMIGHFLLQKPKDWVEPQTSSDFKRMTMFKDKNFILMWLMFYLNIACGLALIPVASPMMTELNMKPTTIALIVAIMGVFNGSGRLVFSAISDKLNKRKHIYYVIFTCSILMTGATIIFHIITPLTLILISATYGAGFSCIAPLLADLYSMKNISKIHGLILSAWAIAGLTGNQISMFIQRHTGSYMTVFYVICGLYLIAMILSMNIKVDDKQ